MMDDPLLFRANTLRSFEVCAQRTREAMKTPDVPTGFVESAGDLGTVFHAVAAEILRTLHRQGERSMATQEAVEIMYEVVADGRIVLPTEDRHELRWLTVRFARDYEWDTRR